jgi:RNA polymerase sigma-70 factor (ECF subfamily)
MTAARGGDGGDVVHAYVELRPMLFSIAYRMLGSVSEAEDLVQEAFIRYQHAIAEGKVIESTKAWLSAVVTRLAIDQLKSARTRRETYVGDWLPEPVMTDGSAPDPLARAELTESLSMSFLLLLERLTPVERAVFLLHDVFGYAFSEVAGIVHRSEATCRQHAVRARRFVSENRPRFDASEAERDELMRGFLAAARRGDVGGLVELLAEDVIVNGDGGGKVPQWSAPIVGADRVARLFAGLGRQLSRVRGSEEVRAVNGQPGIVFRGPGGGVMAVMSFEVVDGQISRIRSIVNPDKLRHLGRVESLREVLEQAR